MTKTMQAFWKNKVYQYINSDTKTLKDTYGRYSENKLKAYYRCLRIMDQHCGRNGCIIAHNTHAFTYAFIGDLIDDETGVVDNALYVITKENIYAVKLDELREMGII